MKETVLPQVIQIYTEFVELFATVSRSEINLQISNVPKNVLGIPD